jgi:hypothetical protein
MSQLLEGSLEENILTLLAYNEIHAPGLILELDETIFSTKIYRDIAKAAIGHIQQYGAPPRAHLWDLMERELRRGDEGIHLRKTLEAMKALEVELQPDYVLSQLAFFIEKRQLMISVEAAADAIHADDLETAKAELYKNADIVATGGSGIWLDDTEAMTAFMDKSEEDRFLTGIEELDKKGVVPARKRFFLLLAPPKRGKSWFLVGVGKAGLIRRHSILHITLENTKEETAQRYVQAFFSMTATEMTEAKVARFHRSVNSNVVQKIEHELMPEKPQALSNTTKAKIARRLKGFKRRARLRIEEFPSGTLTMSKLNALLDKLKRSDDFVPDMILLDYPDLMAVDAKNLRTSLGQLFVQLKGMANQRNCALVAVTQGNREGMQAKTVGATHVGEDFSKIATVDCVVTYSQTPLEKKVGLARLFVAACRYAVDGFIVLISQHYATGQFCLDSTFMTEYMEEQASQFVAANKEGSEP